VRRHGACVVDSGAFNAKWDMGTPFVFANKIDTVLLFFFCSSFVSFVMTRQQGVFVIVSASVHSSSFSLLFIFYSALREFNVMWMANVYVIDLLLHALKCAGFFCLFVPVAYICLCRLNKRGVFVCMN
jgi:hypothetical protein